MTTPVAVKAFQVKSYNSPDEVRTPEKTRVEVINLEGFTLGRLNLEPGWRWSECIKPVVKTDSCQVSHVGYAVAGKLTVHNADGTEHTIVAGDAYTIPPGHDAWVAGDETFVGLEIMSAAQYAKA